MSTLEQMAREAGCITAEGASFGEDYAFRVNNHILARFAALVRADEFSPKWGCT